MASRPKGKGISVVPGRRVCKTCSWLCKTQAKTLSSASSTICFSCPCMTASKSHRDATAAQDDARRCTNRCVFQKLTFTSIQSQTVLVKGLWQ